MERRGVVFIAVKRKNMIKSYEEAEYYIPLQTEEEDRNTILSCRKSVKFIRAVSGRCPAVKIILIGFQLLSANGVMGTMV